MVSSGGRRDMFDEEKADLALFRICGCVLSAVCCLSAMRVCIVCCLLPTVGFCYLLSDIHYVLSMFIVFVR
jgi:hypothetical protein